MSLDLSKIQKLDDVRRGDNSNKLVGIIVNQPPYKFSPECLVDARRLSDFCCNPQDHEGPIISFYSIIGFN